MKYPAIFILALIIVSVSLAGCIGGTQPVPATTVTPQVTTTVVVEVPETTAVPVITIPETAAVTTVPTTSAMVSSEDVRDHFLDVAYTATNRLERLDYNPGRPRVVISVVSAGDDDVALIEKTAQDFNDASPTVKISENIKDAGTGDIVMKFLPQDGLSAISLDQVAESGSLSDLLTRREFFQGGLPAAKVVRGTIYINANLRGPARGHVIVRSLMYQMGLTGESTKFSDSVFYAAENTNTDLSTVDKKVITMLYATEFENGMTMEELRRVLYLP